MKKIDMDAVERMLSTVSFYTNKHDHHIMYAEYMKEDNGPYLQSVDSDDFKSCLRIWYRHQTGSDARLDVKPVLDLIHDESNFYEDQPAIEPHNRVAGNLREGIEYFLADSGRNIVAITAGSWKLTQKSRFKFLTERSQQAQVKPRKSTADIRDLLQPFVNLTGDDLTLFIVWLIQGFSCGTHYGMMLSAERGSGKSTLTRIVNRLLDPSVAEVTIMPKKLDDFQVFLASNYLACFDNVREIPTEHSDTLCTAITGGTVAKRTLYTTSETTYLPLHNVVVINGIDIFPQESDLAERFLLFHLDKLTNEELRTDSSLEQEFETKRPLILGCIFDILAEAADRIKGLAPKEKLRMAEAYVEMVAIAEVMGISEAEFYQIIHENNVRLQQECAAAPLVEAICEFMNGPWDGKRKYSDTSTNVYVAVKNNYSGAKNMLPSSASQFSKKLKAEHDALQAAGFSSIIDDTGSRGSVITIIREK